MHSLHDISETHETRSICVVSQCRLSVIQCYSIGFDLNARGTVQLYLKYMCNVKIFVGLRIAKWYKKVVPVGIVAASNIVASILPTVRVKLYVMDQNGHMHVLLYT